MGKMDHNLNKDSYLMSISINKIINMYSMFSSLQYFQYFQYLNYYYFLSIFTIDLHLQY